MGLLDDAIREHLELKRRHGADPAEVAAQEREVLGAGGARPASVGADAPGEPPLDPPPFDDEPPVGGPFPPEPQAVGFDDDDPLPPPSPRAPGGAVSLDRAALPPDPDPDLDVDWSTPAPDRAPEPTAEEDAEDVLEETPEFLEETPEHDRLWFEQRPPKDFDF